jgi:hypothetical protein
MCDDRRVQWGLPASAHCAMHPREVRPNNATARKGTTALRSRAACLAKMRRACDFAAAIGAQPVRRRCPH